MFKPCCQSILINNSSLTMNVGSNSLNVQCPIELAINEIVKLNRNSTNEIRELVIFQMESTFKQFQKSKLYFYLN